MACTCCSRSSRPRPSTPKGEGLIRRAVFAGQRLSKRSLVRSLSFALACLTSWACEDVVPLGNFGLSSASDASEPSIEAPSGTDESDMVEHGDETAADDGADTGGTTPEPEPDTPPPPTSTATGDPPDASAAPPGEMDDLDGGGAGDASTPEFPSCFASALPGPFNAPGLLLGSTETSTDWLLPAATEGLEWELLIEDEIEPRAAGEAPTSGYYWSQQFYYVQGLAGRIGLQAEGIYQPDPIVDPTNRTIGKMAAFWLAGPPLAMELGDIPHPQARTAIQVAAGATWGTIHALFEWQTCHVYVLRVGPESTDEAGNTWYGAWIADETDGTNTFLGRMLVPADTGLLSPFVRTYTSPIDHVEPQSCEVSQYSSAIFGAPRDDHGNRAQWSSNAFVAQRCATSRFSMFDGAVRHELGVVR